jgi:hypothetical protein
LVVGVGVRARRRSWSWGWSSTWPRDRSLRRIIIVEGVQLASLNCTNEYVDEQDSPERERLLQEVLSTKLHDEKIMEEVRISGVEKPGRGSGVDEREQRCLNSMKAFLDINLLTDACKKGHSMVIRYW